jgi:hypothetical protein
VTAAVAVAVVVVVAVVANPRQPDAACARPGWTSVDVITFISSLGAGAVRLLARLP